MRTVAEIERELAAARAAEEAQQFAERTQRYRQALKLAIDARERRHRAAEEIKSAEAARERQGHVIARAQTRIAELDDRIAQSFEFGLDLRTEEERAVDGQERTELCKRLEREHEKARELASRYGNALSSWISADRAFREADWTAGTLKPISPAELAERSRTIADGMGELNGVR